MTSRWTPRSRARQNLHPQADARLSVSEHHDEQATHHDEQATAGRSVTESDGSPGGVLPETVSPAAATTGASRPAAGTNGASRPAAVPAYPTPPLRLTPRPRRSMPVPEVALHLRLIRLTDAAVGLAVLLAVFLGMNIGRMPDGVREFLAMRITLKNLALLTGFTIVWRLLCVLMGLYDWERIQGRRSELSRVVLTAGLGSAVALAFPAMSVTGAFRYTSALYFWLGASMAMLILRTVVRGLVSPPKRGSRQEAIIVGTGPRALQVYRELREERADDYHVVGFVDSQDHRPHGDDRGVFLGRLDDIEDVLMRHAVDEVLIALPIASHYAEIQRTIESCEGAGVRARYLADLFAPGRGRLSQVDEDHVSFVAAPVSPLGVRRVVKRLIDVSGATLALIVLSPALVLAGLAIKLSSPGPVLFSQPRYGMNRRLFRMYKLRTMVANAEGLQASLEAQNEASGPVFKIRDDPRLTVVGRFLRRTSLDELPQLVNVLLGEMSLVGPRPLPVRDVHRFTRTMLMRRFSVRPGLTCLWQIGGRSDLGFDDWIRLDLKYIDEWSLGLDLKILLKTVPVVVRGTGAA
jgi:exopolysaccharide biosynthesis polyprenyl glycosylphosphotransferase